MTALNAMLNVLHKHGHEMKRTGSKYNCLSPFNNEKTPSFFLYEHDAQWFYKCFSTGKHGDAIALLMELDGQTFQEACTATGQEHKLTSTVTKAPRFSRTKSRVKQAAFTSTQTAPTPYVRPLRESTQQTFLPASLYNSSRAAYSIMAQFIGMHMSKRLADQVHTNSLCLGGDPQGLRLHDRGNVYFFAIDMLGRVARVKVVHYQIVPDKRMVEGYTIKRSSSVRQPMKHYGVTDAQPCLYGLPYVLKHEPCVFIVESEKTVELFRLKTCHSSCVATGGTLTDDALFPLQDRRLVILADLDKREEMELRAEKLRGQGLDIHTCAWWTGYEHTLEPKDDVGDLVQMLTRPECFQLVSAWTK